MEELKPCPACGHTNLEIIECEENPPASYVRCDCCGLQTGPTNEFSPDVVTEWNSLPRREEKDIYQPLSFHPALPRRLKWTREKPTEPGWYWWRFEKNIVPHMVYVVHESTMRPVQTDRMLILYPNSKKELDVETRGGEWAGPIPEPEEA